MTATPSSQTARHIVVIGAGIIGACTACALLTRGYRVTLVEPGPPGGPQAASFGNGAFLSPASIIPMTAPGLWRRVPGYLLDRQGALTIRWRSLPRLLPWLWRFLRAGDSWPKVRAIAASLNLLLNDAPARHLALARATGQDDMIRQTGLIYAFADRAAMEAEATGWQIRRDHGVALRELGADELATLAPDLSPHYRFAMLVTDGAHCRDPGGYVATLVAHCTAHGARLVRAPATGFAQQSGRLSAVMTSQGPLPCDAAVIAAGIGAGALARLAGDPVPLESERGYHIEIRNAGFGPAIPVMPQDGKMANVMTRSGLRASGQVELADAAAPPDWRRADILLHHLRRSYPGLAAIETPEITRWQGNRPSLPDGMPVIGPARLAGVFHGFGHGHIGLASGPVTGEILACLIDGTAPPVPVAAFAAARFR